MAFDFLAGERLLAGCLATGVAAGIGVAAGADGGVVGRLPPMPGSRSQLHNQTMTVTVLSEA